MTRLALACLALLACQGCAHFGSLEEAGEAGLDAVPERPAAWEAGSSVDGQVEFGWVAAFNDPVLSAYVDEALVNNRDLRAAAGVVSEARALARQAGAALYPAVDITAAARRSGVIDQPSVDGYEAGAQLSWEVDVWGRVRSSRRSAALGAYSAEADFLFSQYSLAAAVAQSYFLAIEAGLQLDVSTKSFNALEVTERIVEAQRDIGAASGLDLALSKRDLANARDAVLTAQGAQRTAVRALSVLLGRYPSALTETPPILPQAPPPPPAGLPSDLLERRPDVIAAELSLAAAFDNVAATQAARLPTISLTSSIGGSSSDLSDVLDPENVAWQVVGNLIGPAFDGGLRQARVREARAEQVQAANSYAQTAISAFEEVETSLDQNVVLRARIAALTEAAAEANRAFEIARRQYEEGESNLLDVLTIQNTSFSADSALVSAERSLLNEWINLNLALGGNWATAPTGREEAPPAE
ncbi:MAG: efflux transporter outer membrane subunit [Pseudomonadota bacterium]